MPKIIAWVSTMVSFDCADNCDPEQIQAMALYAAKYADTSGQMLDYAYDVSTDKIVAPEHRAGIHIDDFERV